MGIIDKLKGFLTGVAESRGRTDPVFGDIVFEDDFWSGSASFAPVGGQVGIIVEANEHGPTEQQRQFLGGWSRNISACWGRSGWL